MIDVEPMVKLLRERADRERVSASISDDDDCHRHLDKAEIYEKLAMMFEDWKRGYPLE